MRRWQRARALLTTACRTSAPLPSPPRSRSTGARLQHECGGQRPRRAHRAKEAARFGIEDSARPAPGGGAGVPQPVQNLAVTLTPHFVHATIAAWVPRSPLSASERAVAGTLTKPNGDTKELMPLIHLFASRASEARNSSLCVAVCQYNRGVSCRIHYIH